MIFSLFENEISELRCAEALVALHRNARMAPPARTDSRKSLLSRRFTCQIFSRFPIPRVHSDRQIGIPYRSGYGSTGAPGGTSARWADEEATAAAACPAATAGACFRRCQSRASVTELNRDSTSRRPMVRRNAPVHFPHRSVQVSLRLTWRRRMHSVFSYRFT